MATALEIRREPQDFRALPWKLPLRHLSASSVKLMAECPEKWRRRYLLGEREPGSVATVLGSAVHGALAVNFFQKIESKQDMPRAEVQDAYRDVFKREAEKVADEVGDYGDMVKWEEGFGKGLDLTTKYYEEIAPRIQPIGVEQEFRRKVIDGLPPLYGFIDLVTEAGMTDYKTASRKVSKPKGEWRIQGRIYQAILPATFFWHILTKTKEPAIYTQLDMPELVLPFRSDAVKANLDYVAEMAWTMNFHYLTKGEEGPWPTEGQIIDGACARCKFFSSCPAWRD